MKRKIIKFASVTPKINLGSIDDNVKHIVELLKSLHSKKVDIALFSRFSLTGYSLMDLFKNKSILSKVDKSIKYICDKTKDYDTVVVFSTPILVYSKLVDATFIIKKGSILAIKYNDIFDRYSELDESKIFDVINDNESLYYAGIKITKDLYINCNGVKLAISSTPLRKEYFKDLIIESSDCNIFLHSSSKDEYITNCDEEIVAIISKMNQIGYVFAGACVGETSTDLVYSTKKFIFEEDRNALNTYGDEEVLIGYINANLLLSKPTYTEDAINILIEDDETSLKAYKPRKTPYFRNENDATKALELQVNGLTQRMIAIGCNKVVLGVSGGLDSTLALIVCIETMKKLKLPMENIIAITMPGFGTSKTTKTNGLNLLKAFDVTKYDYNITAVVSKHLHLIDHELDVFDTAFENAQARERTQILLDVANMNNAIVVGTGDLSEIALGFATFNGDHISNYCVNASIPKTFVREIIRVYSKGLSKKIQYILHSIIDTPISPELLPTDKNGQMVQITEEIVGPYELHDFFLYYFIKYNLSKEDLILLSKCAFNDIYSKEEIVKWLDLFQKRFLQNQFKRSCSPDGPKVTEISLSPRGSFRMPSDISRNSL